MDKEQIDALKKKEHGGMRAMDKTEKIERLRRAYEEGKISKEFYEKNLGKLTGAERVKTYVIGLDERMEGGVPPKSLVLICGHAGTMKSTLAYNILHNTAIKEGKRGLYITLEQSKESIARHMKRLHMDPDEAENVAIIDLAKVRVDSNLGGRGQKINWIESITAALNKYKQSFGCEVLVFDSLAALYTIADFDKNPRAELFYFFEQLRELDMTTFLISEIPTDKKVFGIFGIEDFLCDGIIHLEGERDGANVNLYIGVVKMRETKHDKTYYPLIFDRGFEIVTE